MFDIDSLNNRDEARIEKAIAFLEATLKPYHRAEIRGCEHIPTGAALYVGNHNSLTYCPEMYLLGMGAFRKGGIDDVPYGLAHEVLLSAPGINQLLCPLGAVRASHAMGDRILQAGKKALVYPGSDFDATRPHRQRHQVVFAGRLGYMRLALRNRVPIVPVVAAGAHSTVYVVDNLPWLAKRSGIQRHLRIKVWPLVLSFPWGLTLGPPIFFIPYPSKIILQVLPPMDFTRPGQDGTNDDIWLRSCDQKLRKTMQDALTRLARELR